jgi:hypothetical protein
MTNPLPSPGISIGVSLALCSAGGCQLLVMGRACAHRASEKYHAPVRKLSIILWKEEERERAFSPGCIHVHLLVTRIMVRNDPQRGRGRGSAKPGPASAQLLCFPIHDTFCFLRCFFNGWRRMHLCGVVGLREITSPRPCSSISFSFSSKFESWCKCPSKSRHSVSSSNADEVGRQDG